MIKNEGVNVILNCHVAGAASKYAFFHSFILTL